MAGEAFSCPPTIPRARPLISRCGDLLAGLGARAGDVAELAAVVALGAEAAGRALRGDVAEVAAVEALLAAAGLLGGLRVRVRRLGAVAADVADLAAVPARLAAAAATVAAAATAGRRRRAGVLRAVPLQVTDLTADMARRRGAGGAGGLAASVLGAVPLEVAGLTADVARLGRHCVLRQRRMK